MSEKRARLLGRVHGAYSGIARFLDDGPMDRAQHTQDGVLEPRCVSRRYFRRHAHQGMQCCFNGVSQSCTTDPGVGSPAQQFCATENKVGHLPPQIARPWLHLIRRHFGILPEAAERLRYGKHGLGREFPDVVGYGQFNILQAGRRLPQYSKFGTLRQLPILHGCLRDQGRDFVGLGGDERESTFAQPMSRPLRTLRDR